MRDCSRSVANAGNVVAIEMRAVRSGRAQAVSRVELLIPGPRTIDGIEHLAAIFHPDAMKR